LFLLISINPVFGWAEHQDPAYMGKPLSYWIESIHSRDKEMALAFSAITTLGPDAENAVPELVRIVIEPFTPVRVGMDERDQIAAKVSNIQLRADAIDALGAIGASAAPAATVLIQWALTPRVVLMNAVTRQDEELFIDLIAIDVLERMRVAGAVAMFGKSALLPVTISLASQDIEERKLAVAILSEHAPPIAALLLKSESCESRKLGLSMLVDMWPVVSGDYLIDLTKGLKCDETMVY
jgi:hypothetical protein